MLFFSQLKVQAQKGYCSQLNIEDIPSTSSIGQLKVQAQEGYCSQLNIEDVPSTSKSIGLNTNHTNEALELANSREKIKLLNEQVAELLQIKSAIEKLFTPRQLKRLQNPKIRTQGGYALSTSAAMKSSLQYFSCINPLIGLKNGEKILALLPPVGAESDPDSSSDDEQEFTEDTDDVEKKNITS
ncbi:unnamed protein product [Diabrotica balteata]|uniref:Uncharacterized protein n=1 Tax=Diabrotica balteata TaxID=107213 RepID=A0A9N9X6R8_DIABA|nr:unnamed protein product [Diabrotica balteata]